MQKKQKINNNNLFVILVYSVVDFSYTFSYAFALTDRCRIALRPFFFAGHRNRPRLHPVVTRIRLSYVFCIGEIFFRAELFFHRDDGFRRRVFCPQVFVEDRSRASIPLYPPRPTVGRSSGFSFFPNFFFFLHSERRRRRRIRRATRWRRRRRRRLRFFAAVRRARSARIENEREIILVTNSLSEKIARRARAPAITIAHHDGAQLYRAAHTAVHTRAPPPRAPRARSDAEVNGTLFAARRNLRRAAARGVTRGRREIRRRRLPPPTPLARYRYPAARRLHGERFEKASGRFSVVSGIFFFSGRRDTRLPAAGRRTEKTETTGKKITSTSRDNVKGAGPGPRR